MKILYLNTNTQDYLAESLLHGLRKLPGNKVVDVPRYDSLYTDLSDETKKKLRGRGFTLYGLLEDTEELIQLRKDWERNIDEYDLIVFSNIFRQFRLLPQLSKPHLRKRIVVLDGIDSPSLFPFTATKRRVKEDFSSLFISFRNVKYFKREFDKKKIFWQGSESFIPKGVKDKIITRRNIKPISFSIPEEKIARTLTDFESRKMFPVHIVDKEIAEHVKKSFFSSTGSDKYTFENETDYYADLQKSRFGITTKRAGWDCLRHYELAANGCVLCFRDLHLKPPESAPFSLDETNCIIYKGFKDLMQQISALNETSYKKLQDNSLQWIQSMTTVNVAKRFLQNCID